MLFRSSIKSGKFMDSSRILRLINQKWPTREDAILAAARVYRMVVGSSEENQLFLASSTSLYGANGLPGFDEIIDICGENGEASPHPANGHHRLGWFMLNYVLINNGLSPVYLAAEEQGSSGPYSTLRDSEKIKDLLEKRSRDVVSRRSEERV